MESDWMLIKAGAAARALQECATAPEAKKLADLGHAAEIYAKRQKLGEESIRCAHAFKVDSQRLLGGFMAGAEKNKGSLKRGPAVPERNSGENGEIPTLEDIGLSRRESSDSQFLHHLAETMPNEFQTIRDGDRSISDMRREIKQRTDAEAHQANSDSESQAAWVGDHREPFEEFNYEAVDESMAEEIREAEAGIISESAGMFSKIMGWVWSAKIKRHKIRLAMIRFLAFSAGLRPDLVDDLSGEEIGKIIGASKQSMSDASIDFQQTFGLKFARSRSDEARANMSRAMIGHPPTHTKKKTVA